MKNEEGDYVDLYVPKKCSSSNKPIGVKDKACQFSIATCNNDEGVYKKGEKINLVLSGQVRRTGQADEFVSSYLVDHGVISLDYVKPAPEKRQAV